MNAGFDEGTCGGGGVGLARQKEADRGKMILRGMEIGAREFACQQLTRRFAQDPGSVTRPTVRSARATMHHGSGSRQGLENETVRRGAAEVGEKPNAAGIMLFERIHVRGVRDRGAGVVRDEAPSLRLEKSDWP